MRLRPRLALTAVAVAGALVGALFFADARSRHATAARALAEAVRGHVGAPGERARCEAAPESWGGVPLRPPGPRHDLDPAAGRGDQQRDRRGHRARVSAPRPRPPAEAPGDERPHGAPPIFFAYDLSLASAHPDAPALAQAWAEAIDGVEVGVPSTLWPGDDVEILVRTPWGEGPCALIYAHGTTTAGWIGALLPAEPLWLLPLLGSLLALLVAAGPLVRRVRRLAELVRSSAAAGFTAPVVIDGDDEVAELSRAFDAAARAVRDQLLETARRERALREFVANTTHDVMTPLTALADHLTSLEESAAAGEVAAPALLTAAISEVHYLSSIIDNLAVAAKLDAAEPALARTPVDLGALLERVVARHRTIARRRGVALEVGLPEQPIEAYADVTMLEQAIGNLVDNAIRYNHRGGHAAALVEAPAPGRFVVRVLDDGPGIADVERARLLERGERGSDDPRTRPAIRPEPGERPGQGLGLAIAVRVAERHGFRLEFDGRDGLCVELHGPTATGVGDDRRADAPESSRGVPVAPHA